MLDRPGDDIFLSRKVSGEVNGCRSGGDADVRSAGANKRPRLLEPDMEAAGSGPFCSPRYGAPPAKGGATKETDFIVGSTEEYEHMCYLGAGSYGIVAKARHRATGMTVAIKRYYGSYDEDDREEMEEELRREDQLLAACDGVPFVVGSRGLARDPTTAELCLVMEYVGPNIDHFLSHQRSRGAKPPLLPEATLRDVMWQLLRAAAGMHRLGVIHRDINPCNVLVVDDLRAVKICDFGMAISTSDPPPYDPSGSPGYRAPEILLERSVYDGRVDVWSLGCVMTEIITGKMLFHEELLFDEELLSILRVLGVPDEEAWPGFLSTPFAVSRMPELDPKQPNVLRELIPQTVLSDQGFEVLSGLLVCNPDKRLTAAAALKLPWFADVDALELLSR